VANKHGLVLCCCWAKTFKPPLAIYGNLIKRGLVGVSLTVTLNAAIYKLRSRREKTHAYSASTTSIYSLHLLPFATMGNIYSYDGASTVTDDSNSDVSQPRTCDSSRILSCDSSQSLLSEASLPAYSDAASQPLSSDASVCAASPETMYSADSAPSQPASSSIASPAEVSPSLLSPESQFEDEQVEEHNSGTFNEESGSECESLLCGIVFLIYSSCTSIFFFKQICRCAA
jgi:hypothetical protein